jgi:hypothetical protein
MSVPKMRFKVEPIKCNGMDGWIVQSSILELYPLTPPLQASVIAILHSLGLLLLST